jgi:hypothetical protein
MQKKKGGQKKDAGESATRPPLTNPAQQFSQI